MPRAKYVLAETGQPIGKGKLTNMARMATIIANIDDATAADVEELSGWPSVVIAGHYFDVDPKLMARIVWAVYIKKGWRPPFPE